MNNQKQQNIILVKRDYKNLTSSLPIIYLHIMNILKTSKNVFDSDLIYLINFPLKLHEEFACKLQKSNDAIP